MYEEHPSGAPLTVKLIFFFSLLGEEEKNKVLHGLFHFLFKKENRNYPYVLCEVLRTSISVTGRRPVTQYVLSNVKGLRPLTYT